MTLGQQVKEAREAKKMTQFHLAHRLGLSLATIQATEGDKKEPRLGTLLKLTRELGPFELAEGGKLVRLAVKGNARE